MVGVEEGLIWTRPERGTQRPKSTRDQIALTAVATRTWEVLMRRPWALQSLQNASAGPNTMFRSADATAMDDETVDAVIRFAEARYATGEFPHMQALSGGKGPREVFPELIGGTSERDRFLHGLAMLLDGAAQRMHLDLP